MTKWLNLLILGLTLHCLAVLQLVRTLLKQAGFDKRTGDLFGNRDLFNKARNMARGLKVTSKWLNIDLKLSGF